MEETLTTDQMKRAKEIMTETSNLRRKITLYKKNDPKLAMFRIKAMSIIQEAVIRKVSNKPWTKKINDFIKFWNDGSDLGNNIQELFQAIKEA